MAKYNWLCRSSSFWNFLSNLDTRDLKTYLRLILVILKYVNLKMMIPVLLFRWFKCTLKPPYSITCGKLWMAIWDTSFWTLRHILGPILVIFEICHFLTIPGPFEYFSKNGWSHKIKKFLMKEWSLPPYQFSFRRRGPYAKLWANLFHNPKHLGGATGHQKLSTTFLTLSWRVKVHLLLRYYIKNVSIGVA